MMFHQLKLAFVNEKPIRKDLPQMVPNHWITLKYWRIIDLHIPHRDIHPWAHEPETGSNARITST